MSTAVDASGAEKPGDEAADADEQRKGQAPIEQSKEEHKEVGGGDEQDNDEEADEDDDASSDDDIEVAIGGSGNEKSREDKDTGTTGAHSYELGLYEETLDLYDLANYTFGKKDVISNGILTRGVGKKELESHLKEQYDERGMRRAVAGLLLVHSHHFPHVLLLQRADGTGSYILPGGKLRPGESHEDGLKRKLSSKLSPPKLSDEDVEWEIGDLICTWWGIDFSLRKYPYIPAHVTKPKEQVKVYLVSLPETYMFAVPKNLQLVAVPLFDLLSRASEYGPVIASVPALLAKYHINYV